MPLFAAARRSRRKTLPTLRGSASLPVTVVLGIFGALAACDGAQDARRQGTGPIVRDSAGIRIVEYSESTMDGLPLWVPAPEPDLSIGVVEGDEAYQFSEIGAVRTLSDGRIVVGNEQPVGLRYFGSNGGFLSSVGREGEGPGEFQFLRDVWVLGGDSLLVSDMRNRRLSVLDPSGSVVREHPVPPEMPGLTRAAGGLGDGSVLFSAPNANGGYARGLPNVLHLLLRVHLDAQPADTIARLETALGEAPMGRELVPAEPNFSPWLSGALVNSRVAWTSGLEFSIWIADPAGAVEQAWRYRVPRAPMDQQTFEAWVDSGAAHVGDPGPYTEFMTALGRPDSLPSIARVRAAKGDRLWIRRYAADQSWYWRTDLTWTWLVVEPDGTPLAWVEIPRSMDPIDANRRTIPEFGRDYILVVERDELGVEYVRRYALVDAVTGERVGG